MAMTQMMKQYMAVKEQYKDCILFYRLGDFYEMFFDDAEKASRMLGLTLTGRDCGMESRAPMCGVPYHAASTYVAKLIEMGEKVAICEQLTEPNKATIVERGVIRVITPGTVMDTETLDSSKPNYLSSVYAENDRYALAWCDISTGELNIADFLDTASLEESLLKIAPSEIIGNTAARSLAFASIKNKILPNITPFSDWAFIYDNAKKSLLTHFEVSTLDSFALPNGDTEIPALGALIEYLSTTQKRKLSQVNSINIRKTCEYLEIDNNTRRNLELQYSMRENKRFGSLFYVLNKTRTPMGARLLTKTIDEPFKNERSINERLDAVEYLFGNNILRQELSDNLSSIRDISRLTGKAIYGNITPIDCVALKESLKRLPYLKTLLSDSDVSKIKKINNSILPLESLCRLIDSAIADDASANLRDGGFIKRGFNEKLDEYSHLMLDSKELIANLEAEEREKTGIRTLRIGYNRVFGYYIEVTKSYQNLVPLNYIRKQTVANAERYITDELKTLESDILNATENASKLELQLFAQIIQAIADSVKELQATAGAIGELDLIVSFAVVAKNNNYVKPTISKKCMQINIVNGRHPVVEALNSAETFIPNDTFIDSGENRTIVLTGPNMAGKSTYMRQVALITIMAQMGCFVPCDSAELCICDRVFTRVGASDNLIFDQSTFMVEMIEVANILRNATKDSLVILDEVGRGTSTLDGLSIAFAVVKYITAKIGCKTLFATHFHELTDLEGTIDGVVNYKILVKEFNDTIIFLRKIARGGTNKSFGIEVASLAGVPKEVIKLSKKMLKQLEEADVLNTQKQLNITDIQPIEQAENDYGEIIDRLNSLDINDISPNKAHVILSELIEAVKENG